MLSWSRFGPGLEADQIPLFSSCVSPHPNQFSYPLLALTLWPLCTCPNCPRAGTWLTGLGGSPSCGPAWQPPPMWTCNNTALPFVNPRLGLLCPTIKESSNLIKSRGRAAILASYPRHGAIGDWVSPPLASLPLLTAIFHWANVPWDSRIQPWEGYVGEWEVRWKRLFRLVVPSADSTQTSAGPLLRSYSIGDPNLDQLN